MSSLGGAEKTTLGAPAWKWPTACVLEEPPGRLYRDVYLDIGPAGATRILLLEGVDRAPIDPQNAFLRYDLLGKAAVHAFIFQQIGQVIDG